jgi:hypothetical protein
MVETYKYNDPERQHKHEGVLKVNKGREYFRLHKVGIIHKDDYAKKHHKYELMRALAPKNAKPKIAKKKVAKKKVVKKKVVKKKVSKEVKKNNLRNNLKDLFGIKSNKVECDVDNENFIRIDLTEDKYEKYKGIRVKFIRKTGRKTRTVGLEIEK